MPTVDHMTNVTNDVINRMNSVSGEAQSSLLSTSFVEDARAKTQAYDSEQTKTATDALLNLGASAVEGATRTAGEIAAIGSAAQAASLLGVPEDVLQAYAVSRNPDATPEELAEAQKVLGQRVKAEAKAPSFGASSAVFAMDDTTYERKITDAIEANKDAKGIVDAISVTGLVKQGNRKKLEQDLSESFAKINEAWKNDDVGGLMATATTLSETIKAVADNPLAVAEYAVESVPGALTGGVGSVGYGLNTFNDALAKYQKDNDGKLPSTKDMQTMAAWSTGAAALDKIGDAKLVKAITETTGKGVKAAAKNLAGTAASEGITEGAQTEAEARANLGTASGEDIYKSGVIGAASGAAISSPGAVVGTVKGATKATVNTANKTFANKREAKKEAVKTGKTKEFTNVKSEKFNLTDSVDVLSKRNTVTDVTPEERTKNYEAAKTQVQARQSELVQKVDEYSGLEARKDELTKPEMTRLQELDKEIPKIQDEITKVAPIVRGMRVSSEDVAAKQQDMDAAVSGDKPSAKRVFNSFKASPEDFTVEQMESLANADNGLSDNQNQELRTQVEVRKLMDEVSGDVAYGGVDKSTGRRMLGIADYNRQFATATTTQGKKAAAGGLARFAQNRIAKATELEQALSDAKSTGKKIKIGSLTINPNSDKLVNTVRAEANAVDKAHKALQAALGEKVEQPQTEVETTTPEAVQEQAESTTEQVEVQEAITENDRTKLLTYLKDKYKDDKDATQTIERILTHLPEDVKAVYYNEDPESVTPEQLKFIEENRAIHGPSLQGLMDTPNKTIYVFKASRNMAETFFHEADHVVLTSKLMDARFAPLGSQEQLAYKNLDNLFTILTQRLKKDKEFQNKANESGLNYVLTGHKGFSRELQLNELITWGRTNTAVREHLKEIDFGKDTAWNKIVGWLGTILGLTGPQMNAYMQLTTTADILVANSILKPEIAKELAKEASVASPSEQSVSAVAADATQPITDSSPVVATVAPSQVKDYSLAAELTKKEVDETQPDYAQNLVAKFFKPSTKKSILNKKNDLMARMVADTEKVLTEVYPDGIPEGAYEVSAAFTKFHNEFVAGLDNVFVAKDNFKQEDYIQYLVNEEGQLPANVKTAMAVSAYEWMVANGAETNFKSYDSIKALLGLTDEEYLSTDAFNLLPSGSRTASVYRSLGGSAFKLLNLTMKPEAVRTAKTNLESSLGMWSAAAMEDANLLVEQPEVTAAQVKNAFNGAAPKTVADLTAETFNLYQADEESVNAVVTANKLKTSFMQDVFGSVSERPLPSSKPMKGTRTVSNSSQEVPERQRKILEEDQKKPWGLRVNTVSSFMQLPEAMQLNMLGYVSDTSNVLDINLPGVQGMNRSIQRELDIAKELYGSMEDDLSADMFFAHTVWKQGRMGLGTRFNPQSSKIHRYMVDRKDWATEVEFGSPEEDFFLLAVGEGFDIEAVKDGSEVALKETKKVLDKPEIRNAIDAVKASLDGDITSEQQAAIELGVKTGKGKMKTYLSLVAMAEQERAFEKGDTTFTHSLAREVDGITNGVCITTIQMATDDLEKMFGMLQRMGVYNKDMSFVEWNQDPKNQDSYKTLARDWELYIQANQTNPNKLTAASKIFGSFMNPETGEVTKDGRNIAKNPLMTSIYGASIDTIVGNLGNIGIQKVYDELEAIYQDPKGKQEKLNTIISAVNELAGTKFTIKTMTDLKKFKLNNAESKRFREAVAAVYGEGLKEAMDVEYSETFQSRTKLNGAANLAHSIFMAVRENRINEIIASKEGSKFLKELTVQEERDLREELRGITPIVNTANSKLSSGDLDTQLKTGLVLSGGAQAPNKSGPAKASIKLASGKSKTTQGQTETYNDPGAAPIPAMIQSVDAATQVSIMSKITGVNVHDAEYISGNDYYGSVQQYNQGFLQTNAQYSVPQEIYSMLSRVVSGAQGYELDKDTLTRAISSTLGMKFKDAKAYVDRTAQEDVISSILDATRDLVVGHVNARNNVLRNIVKSEQYSNGEKSAFSPNRTMGSSSAELNEYNFDSVQAIDKFNMEQVFDVLQTISEVKDGTDHLEHLRNTILSVKNQINDPMNMYLAQSADTETIGSFDGVDIRIVNQTQGSTPLSGVLANGIRMSASEVYSHELVHAVSHVAVDKFSQERTELQKLWNQAKEVITVRDFMNDINMLESDAQFDIEYAAAKERYDHVFTPASKSRDAKGRRRSDHLHEFVALGMTNANFRKALSKVEYAASQDKVDATGTMGRLVQSVENWFQKVTGMISSWLLGTKDKTGDKQLEELFKAFAGVSTSNKAQLIKKSDAAVGVFTKPVQEVVDRVKPGYDATVGAVVPKFTAYTKDKLKVDTRAKEAVDLAKEAQRKLETAHKGSADLLSSVFTEMRGRYEAVGTLHDMKRKANNDIDRERMQARANMRQAINEAFGEELTPVQKEALSKVLLKTDITAITGTQDEVLNLINDDVALNERIADLEQNLIGFENSGKYYNRQAKALGHFMATGKARIANLMMNANNIANMFGTVNENPSYASLAEPIIDELASLYALKYTSTKQRKAFTDLDTDGLSFAMALVKQYRKDSDKEFEGNKVHMIKGYMKDKFNPNIDIRVGTLAEQKDMEAEGYILKGALEQDPMDKTARKHMYVNPHGGSPRHIGGVAYLTTEASRGTSYAANTGSDDVNLTGDELKELKQKAKVKAIQSANRSELDTANYMVPILNGKGEIVDYRYLMQENTKDDVMQRDSSFDDIMGMMSSSLQVKDSIREQNKELVKVLRDAYVADPDKQDFIEVGPQSTNEDYRQMWRQLPKDMQEEVLRMWGTDRLYIKKNQADLLFGYHNYSLANMWKLPKEERKVYQQLITSFVEMIFGKKAAMRVRQGEELMQALATTAKDIIVIKSGMVTLGNMVSNVTMLKMMGVPLVDILKGHKESWKGMRAYKRDAQRAEILKLKLGSTKLTNAQRSVWESELLQLEDNLVNNPVIKLIDQGLLSTIVEDVDTEVEEYKLRQRVARKYSETDWFDKLEDQYNRVPEGLKTVVKEAFVMKGSNMYDFLSESAQFSDFGARYVLFNHMVKDGMSEDKAAGEVMDIFIDYDLPSHKGLQYLNNIGILMFIKYLLRVQKMIGKLFTEHTARTMSILLLQNFFGDVSDITDSAMFVNTNPLTRIANPITSFLGAGPDIITLKPFL